MIDLTTYALLRKQITSAASGVSDVRAEGDELIFVLADGREVRVAIPATEIRDAVVRDDVLVLTLEDDKEVVVDATLTQSGQAADAKVTGDVVSQLKDDIDALVSNGGAAIDETLTKSGWAADAAATGTALKPLADMNKRLTALDDDDFTIEWEQGAYIGSDYKTKSDSSGQIRTTGYVNFLKIKNFSINTSAGFTYRAYFYDKDYNYLGLQANAWKPQKDTDKTVYVTFCIIRYDPGITPETDFGLSVEVNKNGVIEQVAELREECARLEQTANGVVTLEQGSIAHSGGDDVVASHYIRTKGYIPYDTAYKIKANAGYIVYVFFYRDDKSFSSMVVLDDGFGEYTVPYYDGIKYIRLSIKAVSGADITPDENAGLCVFGQSKFRQEYEEYKDSQQWRDFIKDNKHSLPIATTCFKGSMSYPTDMGMIVVADLHGDYVSLDDAKTLYDYSRSKIGISGDLPIVNLGDTVPGVATGTEADAYMLKATLYGVYHVMGQHECGFYDTADGRKKTNCLSHEEVFNKFIAPMKTIWGLDDLSTVYYYKDFTQGKMRLISLYQYNAPLVDDSSDSTLYKYSRAIVWYGQEQLDWFVDTLQSVPDGYKVVVLLHQPEKTIENTLNTAFFSGDTCLGGNLITNGAPIVDIVNAYMERATLKKTYTANDTAKYPTDMFTMSVDADFTSAKGLFANYLSGDAHIDYVGTVQGTEQKHFGITSSCYSQCYDCSLIRVNNGTIASSGTNPESSIVTVIGYESGAVKIGRIGQQYSCDGKARMIDRFVY